MKQNLGDGGKTQLFPKNLHAPRLDLHPAIPTRVIGVVILSQTQPGQDSKIKNKRTVTAGDGNPRDSGCASPLERHKCWVPAHCPPTGNFQAVSSHSVVFFFFPLSQCIFLSIHGNTSPPSSGRKPSSLSLPLSQSWREEMQLEWVEIFPLKHFFPVENVFSNYAESFVNARTVLIIHWGALLFPPRKIPHSRCCTFWQLQTPFFFFFFHRGKIWVETPKLSKKNTRTEVA